MEPWPTSLPELSYVGTRCQSERSTQNVRLVVVHDPEGGYRGTVNYIKNKYPDAYGVSYHVLLSEDGKLASQFVPWEKKAWSCARFNSVSDNVSIAGYKGNAWSYPALNRLARVIAFRLHKRGLPAKFCWKPDINDVPAGWTFHSELGAAGGSHLDPGLTGPKFWFLHAAVKYQLAVGAFRPSWGR